MSNSFKARHKRPTQSHTRQGVALAVTTVVSAGVVIGGAGAAGAAENPVSQSRGFFLSGSALGQNLNNIVELDDARAVNTGSPAVVRELNPLSATVLNSLTVPLGPVNLLGNNGLLTLGAVNQAAIARADCSAIGASGAVTDSGAIAVNGQSGVPAANATLDLDGALPGGVAGVLTDLDLNVGALAGVAKQAKGENGAQTGDYRIAQLRLVLESPLLAGALDGLGLGGVDETLAGLVSAVDALDPGNLLGLDVTGLSGFDNIAVDNTLGEGGPVQVNTTNGTVTVDVEALLQSLGLDLNNLPPNTEIVKLIANALNGAVVDLVVAELDRVVAAIGTAVEGLGVDSTLPLLPALQTTVDGLLAGVGTDLTAPLTERRADLLGSNSLLDPLFGALDDVLSLVVNVQSRSNGQFTQGALRVGVVPASDLARVNLGFASVGPGQCRVAEEPPRDDEPPVGDRLPDTGAAESAPLAAAGLALMLAGAAATAGSGRMGSSSGAHAGARGRGSSGGGRHARR